MQPNAVDLRLGKVYWISSNTFLIDEERKIHRGTVEILPKEDGYYHLEPGHYEVLMQNKMTVGDNEAGWVITRSTLNRNGVFITSGLYDTGYSGIMAGVLHVTIGPMKIAPGTRIGQNLTFDAQALHKYDSGCWDGKEHDEKYK